MNKINIKDDSISKVIITSAMWQEFDSAKKFFEPLTNNIEFVETGIGKVCSLANLAPSIIKLKELYNIKLVINLGVTGSVDFKPGTMLWCTNFLQGDIDIDWFPIKSNFKTNQPIDNSAKFFDMFAIKNENLCISSDFFTTKDKAKHHVCVYDMETYGQAALCNNLDIPFFALKYVSDECDDSHPEESWQHIVKHASDMMAEELSKIFEI